MTAAQKIGFFLALPSLGVAGLLLLASPSSIFLEGPWLSTPMMLYRPIVSLCKQRQAPCRIRLTEATPFAWDRVVFLLSGEDPATRGIVLREDQHSVDDFIDDRIIFLLRGEVVRIDARPFHSYGSMDIDPVWDRTVWVDARDGGAPEVVARGDDLFNVVIRTDTRGTNISLEHVPSPAP